MRDERLESSLREIDDLKAALNGHVIAAFTGSPPKTAFVDDKLSEVAVSAFFQPNLTCAFHTLNASGYHIVK